MKDQGLKMCAGACFIMMLVAGCTSTPSPIDHVWRPQPAVSASLVLPGGAAARHGDDGGWISRRNDRNLGNPPRVRRLETSVSIEMVERLRISNGRPHEQTTVTTRTHRYGR